MHQVRYVSVLFVVYNVLLVWCVEMQCDEWVMHGMMRWAVWWMGDA